jgi:ribose transport system permease protein
VTNTLLLLAGVAVVYVVFTVINPRFTSLSNLNVVLKNLVVTGILATALTPLMITRGLDFSFGSSLSFSTVIVAQLFSRYGFSIWWALAVGIVLCTLIGLWNGFFIERFNVPPLLFTIGMMNVLYSLALLAAQIGRPGLGSGQATAMAGSLSAMSDELYRFGTRSFLGIPLPAFLLCAVLLAFWFMLRWTKAGAMVRAVGGNPDVAALLGIRIHRVRIALYVAMGFCTGIAALVVIANSGTGSALHGLNMPLVVLSSVLVGGIGLNGGRGNVWGTLLGVILMTVIYNGLAIMNVTPFLITSLQGLILLLIVVAYEIRNRKRMPVVA